MRRGQEDGPANGHAYSCVQYPVACLPCPRAYLLPPIPKLIHQVWLPNWAQVPGEVRGTRAEWCRLNPGWEMKFWGAEEVGELVGNRYCEFASLWKVLQRERLIKQADFARLIILHRFGGIYADMDLVPLRPIDFSGSPSRIIGAAEFTSPGEPPRICNGFLGSPPNNPIWLEIIREAAEYVHGPVLQFLGPVRISRHVLGASPPPKHPPFIIPWRHVVADGGLDGTIDPMALCQNLQHRSWGEPGRPNGDWYNC